MKKKSGKQLYALRSVRNRELKSVRCLDPGFSCQGKVGKLVGLYIQLEVFAKKLQHYYRIDAKKAGKDELRIDILKAAIKHFRLCFSGNHVNMLFKGGRGTKGKKSARQLRNGYLHNLSPEDKKEIIKNADSFSPKLETFLALELQST